MKIKVDRNLLIALINKTMDGHCHYELGGKAPSLDADSLSIEGIDCSGYVRWLLHRISGITIPDGSWTQRKWCQDQGFKSVKYGAGNAGQKDNILRIAFMDPIPGESGHVWLIINGQTIESFGGHGPGRRDWNEGILMRSVDYCFVLSET